MASGTIHPRDSAPRTPSGTSSTAGPNISSGMTTGNHTASKNAPREKTARCVWVNV